MFLFDGLDDAGGAGGGGDVGADFGDVGPVGIAEELVEPGAGAVALLLPRQGRDGGRFCHPAESEGVPDGVEEGGHAAQEVGGSLSLAGPVDADRHRGSFVPDFRLSAGRGAAFCD